MAFYRTISCQLNRLLVDPRYDRVLVNVKSKYALSKNANEIAETELDFNDERVVHIKNVLSLQTGDSIRTGVVDGGIDNHGTVFWNEENKKLKLNFQASALLPDANQLTGIDLIVAMPSPRILARILPLLSSIGVDNIFLTGAAKVDKRYLASHYLQPFHVKKLHDKLRVGLEQSGNRTRMPQVELYHTLRGLFKSLDKRQAHDRKLGLGLYSSKLLAHPKSAHKRRCPLTGELLKNFTVEHSIGTVPFLQEEGEEGGVNEEDSVQQRKSPRLLLAIGPDGGWDDPSEIDIFVNQGFTPVSLAGSVGALKTEAAITALVTRAHERLDMEKHGVDSGQKPTDSGDVSR